MISAQNRVNAQTETEFFSKTFDGGGKCRLSSPHHSASFRLQREMCVDQFQKNFRTTNFVKLTPG